MNVMIGTPSYDGKLTVQYVDSLTRTVKYCAGLGINIYPYYVCYDALIQRARNDIFQAAINSGIDYLFFIDSDQGWNENDFVSILKDGKDFSGAPVPKKSDKIIDFNVKLSNGDLIYENNLLKVASLGTGFLKLSKSAIKKIWDYSIEYSEPHKKCKMVFCPEIINGELYSEDTSFCLKWNDFGGEIWCHTNILIDHVGTKIYSNNIMELLNSPRK